MRQAWPLRFLAAVALFSLLWTPAPASAHAIVVAANPAVGATVRGASIPIILRFNSRVDPRRSRLTLIGPSGKAVHLTLMNPAVDSLTAQTPQLIPGAYRLRWQVLSIDGHVTYGEIPFTVVAQ